MLRLSEFDFELEYRQGSRMQIADCLSRNSQRDTQWREDDEEMPATTINSEYWPSAADFANGEDDAELMDLIRGPTFPVDITEMGVGSPAAVGSSVRAKALALQLLPGWRRLRLETWVALATANGQAL